MPVRVSPEPSCKTVISFMSMRIPAGSLRWTFRSNENAFTCDSFEWKCHSNNVRTESVDLRVSRYEDDDGGENFGKTWSIGGFWLTERSKRDSSTAQADSFADEQRKKRRLASVGMTVEGRWFGNREWPAWIRVTVGSGCFGQPRSDWTKL